MPDEALPIPAARGSLYERTYRDGADRPLLGELSFLGADDVPFNVPVTDGHVSFVLAPGRYVITERLRTADNVHLPRSTTIFESS